MSKKLFSPEVDKLERELGNKSIEKAMVKSLI